MSTDLISLNPTLKPLKAEADAVREAIQEFRSTFKLEPCYLVVNPSDWRAGISYGYLGLSVVKDPTVAKWKVSA